MLLEPLRRERREDRRRLRELHVAVVDDLDLVAPRIAEAQPAARRDVDAGPRERRADALFVIDDEPEVTPVVGTLPAPGAQREELVAEIDLRHRRPLSAQLEVQEAPVQLQRRVDVADLQREVVDASYSFASP